ENRQPLFSLNFPLHVSQKDTGTNADNLNARQSLPSLSLRTKRKIPITPPKRSANSKDPSPPSGLQEAGANSRVNRDQRPLQRVLALDALKSVRHPFIIIGELKVTLLKIDVGRNGGLQACFLSQNATEAWV